MKRTAIVLGILTSLGLLAAMLSQLDLSAAWAQLKGIDVGWLLASLAASLLVLLARGARFWALLERSSAPQVIAAIAVQNFLTRVTPLRLGELSLPYTLQRIADEPAADSLVLLALVRLVEIWVLGVFALGGAALVFGGGGGLAPLWWTLAVATGLLLSFRWWVKLGAALLTWGLTRSGLRRIAKVDKALDQLHGAIARGARYGLRGWSILIGGTVVVMVGQFLLCGAIILACGVEVTAAQVIVGASGGFIASALPLLTVGNVGALEAGWAAGFVWVGLTLEAAILTGLVAQIVTLLFAALFAAFAFGWLGRGGVTSDRTP